MFLDAGKLPLLLSRTQADTNYYDNAEWLMGLRNQRTQAKDQHGLKKKMQEEERVKRTF